MSAHMKGHHTNYIDIRIAPPGGMEIFYHIPNTNSVKEQLELFFNKFDQSRTDVTPWEEATPWEVLAKDRIEKYKKSGIVLRGARLRENMSQVELERKSGVGQNEISKIENGKRGIGEKVAKKLAKALHFDYQLLLEDEPLEKSQKSKKKLRN
jgi:ribosome-binding protein aMBF1 (putative translation factor)